MSIPGLPFRRRKPVKKRVKWKCRGCHEILYIPPFKLRSKLFCNVTCARVYQSKMNRDIPVEYFPSKRRRRVLGG